MDWIDTEHSSLELMSSAATRLRHIAKAIYYTHGPTDAYLELWDIAVKLEDCYHSHSKALSEHLHNEMVGAAKQGFGILKELLDQGKDVPQKQR